MYALLIGKAPTQGEQAPCINDAQSLLEQNDEWQLQRRYLALERLQSLADNQPARLSAVVS